MATDKEFLGMVMDRLALVPGVTSKSMFGEYGIFAEGKMFALVCDNRLLFKPTEEGRAFIGDPNMAEPYPGAKLCFLIEEKLDDREWLADLSQKTVRALPLPKKRAKKKKP